MILRNRALALVLLTFAAATHALVEEDGSLTHKDKVKPGKTDVYHIRYVGGQMAGAGIRGDGDTDLDLYVYDDGGNLICSSETDGDLEMCTWSPRWTGTFSIKVTNRGDVFNRYVLVAN